MIPIHQDRLSRIAYATDASAYRQLPYGVAYPTCADDIKELIIYARRHSTSIIPRAGGTSLAGQVVGDGIVADVSLHMNRLLEINTEQRWVRVQPGMVLDELNLAVKPHGLFFSPETSTSNRCCVGGMVGNNSCGSHSLVYGSTRDHLLEAKVILSDGYETDFKSLTPDEFHFRRTQSPSQVERNLYQFLFDLLSNEENRELIVQEYPDPSLPRRNTGYALDELSACELFDGTRQQFNLCKLLAGSEGTLVFVTELKLNLTPLPPKHEMLVAVHCHSFREGFTVNLEALSFAPTAVEMIDYNILELSARNLSQQKNRAFVEGTPQAIILIELAEETEGLLNEKADRIERQLKEKGLGYAYPRLTGKEIAKVWALRKAGLGLLSSMPGDAKPVPLTEDTAVAPVRLADYIEEFDALLARFGLSCVYYGHIATGELHLRPILNLKDAKHVELFREVGREVARLVKKHKGSLSGEHGDGRLRGEFIPIIYGEKVYQWFRSLKQAFDPNGVFNPHKIVDTPPMNEWMRFLTDGSETRIESLFAYTPQNGVLQSIEQCNGSADCRKSDLFGGVMCPSYRATRKETNSTRARANVLRELISRPTQKHVFGQPEIEKILDLCLSCKGCRSECPSNVDMARIKAEIMQLVHDQKGASLQTEAIAQLSFIQGIFRKIPVLYNGVVSSPLGSLIKWGMGFSQYRSIPLLSSREEQQAALTGSSLPAKSTGRAYLFVDEFTRYNEAHIGRMAREVMERLGVEVIIAPIQESGRTLLSKGFVRRARALARQNILQLRELITDQTPLVGIEPSCLLTLRDEYIDLAGDLADAAREIAKNTLLFDEWVIKTHERTPIPDTLFTEEKRDVIFHAHCHQKALASSNTIARMLALPKGYRVKEIPSGCCGMAGAFGYEEKHYALSKEIGELKLFPAVRAASRDTIVVAGGTSCRTHIKDATGKSTLHPIEALRNAFTM